MNFLNGLMDHAQLAPAYRLVVHIIVVLGLIALAFCVLLVVHHGITSTRRRRRTLRVERATPLLASSIGTGAKLKAAIVESRREHGDWATSVVLREARREIRGEQADQISVALTEMGEVTRLRGLLRSRQDWRRVQAARELGQCGGDEARDALAEASRDPVPQVRRAAREGLLADGRKESVETAIASYKADDTPGMSWRRSFHARLAMVAPETLAASLANGELSGSEEKLALEALGEARYAQALPLARARLAHAEPEIRATAARVVGKLGDRGSSADLTRLLSDEEWYVRAAAAKAFESVEVDDATFRALRERLADEAWWVRANAAHALAQRGERGVETLLDAVQGQDAFSRDVGLAALGHAMMVPASRRHLELSLRRLPPDSPALPLRRLLDTVPQGLPDSPRPYPADGARP